MVSGRERMRRRDVLGLLAGAALPWPRPARASQALLDEAVGFAGQILFLAIKTPALVLGVVHGGQTTIQMKPRARIPCFGSARSPRRSPARFWRAWPRTAWSALPIL